MLEFKAKPRKWGNSIGITLPNMIVEEGNIKDNKEIEVIIVEKKVDLKKVFGSIKLKESTQKIKDKMRAGWEPTH